METRFLFTHIVVVFDLVFELTKADLDDVDLEKRKSKPAEAAQFSGEHKPALVGNSNAEMPGIGFFGAFRATDCSESARRTRAYLVVEQQPLNERGQFHGY